MSAGAHRTTLSLTVPDATRLRLDELARRTGRSEAALVSDAVGDYVERELATLDAVGRGLADMDAGRVTPHEQAMARLRAAIAGVASDE
jgi:predicted transcriptional regulator